MSDKTTDLIADLGGALILVGRLADSCISDMQGRLQDSEHRRAFMVLEQIRDIVSTALEDGADTMRDAIDSAFQSLREAQEALND